MIRGNDDHDDDDDRDVVVWLQDGLRDPNDAVLHWSDHGLTVGDGVFETMKVVGEPFALRRHLDRLIVSAAGLALDLPDRTVLESAVREVSQTWVQRHGEATARLRLTVTAGRGPAGSDRGTDGPTLLVTAGAMAMQRDPTAVVVSGFTRNERGALAGLKTTSYAENVVALATALGAGASEAIFANNRGELCEGTGTNVFLALDGKLVTPPLSSGCLAGVTRALLLEALEAAGTPASEAAVDIVALSTAPEAFLVSTGREVQPIHSVDTVELGATPGRFTSAAMEIWDSAYGYPAVGDP